MSILVKGMEIPKDFDQDVYIQLACGVDGNRYARLYNSYLGGGLTDWCEIVPVPPHGDLIDRDKLEKDIDNYIGGEESRSRFHHWVQVQDAVIPMDKEKPMRNTLLFEFLKEHEHEDIRIYADHAEYLSGIGIRIMMRLNFAIVSKVFSYEELMSASFSLKDVLNDMYVELKKEDY